jgi:homoserine O-acetyltransferase
MLVEKLTFSMPSYTTGRGETIREVRVGYECYGQLNAAGDNAILICHYFSGSSHCAGKYSEDDSISGYWDALIGPGKAIDTDKYFVVSSDTLCNISVKNPKVVTTGPASINPDTGKPYGMRFPMVTVRDFVRVQKALIDHLRIKHLHAVVGPSMGAAQVFEWGAQYPEMVDRLVAVVPPGLRASSFLVAIVGNMLSSVFSDSNWNGGDYYEGEEPQVGLSRAMGQLSLLNQSPQWSDATFGRRWAAGDPVQDWKNSYLVNAVLDKVGNDRARESDANHFLYWSRVVQTYAVDEEGGRTSALRAPVLLIPCRSDQLMLPVYSYRCAEELHAQGTPVELFELDSDGGHLGCVTDAAKIAPTIQAFLERI